MHKRYDIAKAKQPKKSTRQTMKLKRLKARHNERSNNLNVRQDHLVSVQASLSSIGLGILHKAKHDLAGPVGRKISTKPADNCNSIRTHFCGQRPLV
jgi:hypothetical protein